MDKEEVLSAISEIRKISKKRNFKQNFDLIINLKGLNLKKSEENINIFVNLHYGIGKKLKVCGFVDQQLASKAKEVFDSVVLDEDFDKYSRDKKLIKGLVNGSDVFVAQANLMGKVATAFGKTLGPRGKMPNPKVGGVITPATNLKVLYDKFQKTIHLQTKNELILKCGIGNEDMKDEEIVDNIITVYNSLMPVLPQEKANIRSVLLKMTMGPVVYITGKDVKKEKEKKIDEEKKVDVKKVKKTKEKSVSKIKAKKVEVKDA